MQALFTVLIRLLLLAAGLVIAASLAVVVALALAAWSLRYAWARLTGRLVSPFVVHIDQRAGFGRIYRGRGSGEGTAQAEPVRPKERVIGDITDVEPKPPRDHA